jgi:ABC-type branched-subunit amino acid transport system substrate-binding protein
LRVSIGQRRRIGRWGLHDGGNGRADAPPPGNPCARGARRRRRLHGRRLGEGGGPIAQAPAQPANDGRTIGNGSVKVALILPMSGQGQGSVAAASMRNAAELAIAEFQNPDLTILVKDDRGTAEGARQAAEEAVAEGAELFIGPLFAGSVQAAGQVAKQAGKPVLAFSTDATVASRGVYLLSFLAQEEVDRIIGYASNQGRRSFAALVPENTYGNVVEASFREAAAKRGARVVAMERYAPGQAAAAVQRIAPLIAGPAAQADALFIPDTAEGLAMSRRRSSRRASTRSG